MEKRLEEIATKIASELLSLIGIDAEVKISPIEAEETTLHVELNAPKEAGLLIGAHGSTLQAIQSFLAIAIKQETGDWVRIIVDVGDWRQKQEEGLRDLALQAAERARTTHEPQHLYNLTPHQRRVIHMCLGEESDIVTESEGEGTTRYLVVKQK